MPRLFMPTSLFSRRSMRPTPCAPPRSLSCSTSARGPRRTPSRETGRPSSDLIVPLAGATVGEGIGPLEEGDLNLVFGDERPRHRRAEKVLALVDAAGAQGGKDVVADELLAGVNDVGLGGSAGEGLGFDLRE